MNVILGIRYRGPTTVPMTCADRQQVSLSSERPDARRLSNVGYRENDDPIFVCLKDTM